MTMTKLLGTLALLTLMSLGAAGQEGAVVPPQDAAAELTDPGLIKADVQG